MPVLSVLLQELGCNGRYGVVEAGGIGWGWDGVPVVVVVMVSVLLQELGCNERYGVVEVGGDGGLLVVIRWWWCWWWGW